MLKTTSIMQNMEEQWKPIIGYEGLYEISTLGRVKSLVKAGSQKELILKINTKTEYPVVYLTKNNKQKNLRIHRLLALHFIPNPNNYLQVNHINGNKHDNRLENLEWCSDRQNRLHAYAMGLKSVTGEKNGNAALTEREVKFIRYIKGLHPEITAKEVAEFFGVTSHAINDIWRFDKWKD